MQADEFIVLVSQMRAAQKKYFKNRLQGDLIAARDLEGRVDKALRDGVSIETGALTDAVFEMAKPTPAQIDLFGNPDGQGDTQ